MEQLLVEIHQQIFRFTKPRKEAVENWSCPIASFPQKPFCWDMKSRLQQSINKCATVK